MDTSLSLFHPLIQKWFKEKVGKPTEVQEKGWPVIAKGAHVLITAPTGSGKTLAAFLWAINQFITGDLSLGRIRILYISPLKALNNDVKKNLIKPLSELQEIFSQSNEIFPEIKVLTRSGDTPTDERQKMLSRPPEILITTPESLNILLTSKNSRLILTNISTVILDEIHAVAGNKRGTHLITAIDRLVLLTGEFQRIALSATVNPIQKIADFVGGFQIRGESSYEKRRVTLVKCLLNKDFDVQVTFPENAREQMIDDSWWPVLIPRFKDIIEKNTSTLFFANNRRITEKVTRLINENETEEIAYSHHGSLSKEIRLAVEQKLKSGDLKAIIATSSLELGIDIGDLDRVVLIQTPFSISSALQRIGRSGHKVGDISRGFIFPTYGRDFLNAAVIARSIIERDIEETRPIQCPLDVLAQVILSMTCIKEWDRDKLYFFLKTSYPYHNLSQKQFDLVIEMLCGRYADSRIRELRPRVSIDKIDNTIKAKQGSRFLVFMAGGTIPDRGYYNLRLKDTKSKIGELDEEFVWERKVGETFTLGTQLWRIQSITHNDVEVIPAKHELNIIPFWKAEELNRDFFYSEKILDFLEYANQNLSQDNFKKILQKEYFMNPSAADELTGFLTRQKKMTQIDLPHRHHVLIEHFDDPFNKSDSKQVIIHTLWGGKINRPFGLALSQAWEKEYGYPLQIIANNDAILIMLPHEFHSQDIFRLIVPENIEKLIRLKLEETGFFGARFRENAGRALLLPKSNFKKRMPLWLLRLRSKKLLKTIMKYKDFPILIETYRECFQDEFDLDQLKELLEEIYTGKIIISKVITQTASPFAESLIWKQSNKYMYEDDTPLSQGHSSLSEELLKEIIYSSHLRPKIPKKLIQKLDAKLKRTVKGYAPSSSLDFSDWVKERLLIPESEYKDLVAAILRDGLEEQDFIKDNDNKLIFIKFLGQKNSFIAAIENIHKILLSFNLTIDDIEINPIVPVSVSIKEEVLKNIKMVIKQENKKKAEKLTEQKHPLSQFLSQWLSFYGPMEKSDIYNHFKIDTKLLDEALEVLLEEQTIILDKISESGKNLEVCDTENLEILLRMARRSREPLFEPLTLNKLPLFLAMFQGITSKGESLKDLQQRLDQLFGYSLPAASWEELIFPARLKTYYTTWMDSLLQSSEMIWFGTAKMRTSFSFIDDLELFQQEYAEKMDREKELFFFPEKIGKYSLFDLLESSGLSTKELSHKLWDLTWEGRITNDTYVSLRKAILNRFQIDLDIDKKKLTRRSGFNRWKSTHPMEGNWYIIKKNEDTRDVIGERELVKDRIRQLFKRYGILFKEMAAQEQSPFQWKRIFKELRLMELSGEIISGYFFQCIPGVQFISHEAFGMLRNGLMEDSYYWINATDPASLCGIKLEGIKETLPNRILSNFLVYYGHTLIMTVKQNSKVLEITLPPDHPRLKHSYSIFKDLLNRDFNPMKRIFIEKINAVSVFESPYKESLLEFGFRESYKGLEIRKVY